MFSVMLIFLDLIFDKLRILLMRLSRNLLFFLIVFVVLVVFWLLVLVIKMLVKLRIVVMGVWIL